ncbi:UNVERIFIED_CONTAM: hypothetical protein Slati_1933300 [Sesamum latifolium]|uniref:Uncharacterized protein n=1 Tax=Sesamum latifolium TaxID=2727402 RepID=A0AAW2X1Q2_9LAMI
MAWVCLSEENLDHILGEAEAEVRGHIGHTGSPVVEEKTFTESLPQPMIGDKSFRRGPDPGR